MIDLDAYILSLVRIAREEKAEVTATKLQKIFFLLEKEMGTDFGLNFVPYMFGPYSLKLQEEVNKLLLEGKIKAEDETIHDIISGVEVGVIHKYYTDLNVTVDERVEEFFRKWVKKSRKEILNYVYTNYPEYTKYSVIRDKVLKFNE
ncbi:conjugal transfer protein [Acidianus sp. RZ1]|uniref:conjugal transfer protein n=1 Tax=Acidianus sp. RZ1 TaxID=1540082 RepID=UPI0014916D17|nr:conjugal transfer protein [Acidianus sp. RZ1]NON63153.1 conjugal transfer protein [Acidianus sp. RZ1]